MGKTYSCKSLHHSIYAGPDVLRHCCKRFFVDGKMKGDVVIHPVGSDADISYEKIREHKQRLFDDINSGKETPCTGCQLLTLDDWPSLSELDIRYISIETHSVCNLRCVYCSDIYYGGKKSSYDVRKLLECLDQRDAFKHELSLVWGGGEPVLLPSFEEIFPEIVATYRPEHNHLFTNAVTYSQTLEKYLAEGLVNIAVSLDSGLAKTFKAVRGKDKLQVVLENLRRYHLAGGEGVTIKYILLPENCAEDELSAFIENIESYGLVGCGFQISADFKEEMVDGDLLDAAFLLHKKLKEKGAKIVNFDYHLRPHIDKLQYGQQKASSSTVEKDIIVWGAGEYALRMVESDLLTARIKYFVDSDPMKQGKTLHGLSIKDPDAILEEKDANIFIASIRYHGEIYQDLIKMGVPFGNIMEANMI